MRVGDPPVGGRYSLVAPFGADERFAGGKVATWHARDTLVERDVVLRVITPGGNSARLFMDRAMEMSMIAHPGLGVVYEAVDHGEYAIVVCEWIEGTSLADTLKTQGPLSPAIARKTLGDVAEAITAAHHAGLPIGGLRPERVMLRDKAAVTVCAVPALFADERGDIQQLGQLLYAALTGEQPDHDVADVTEHLPRSVPRDLAVLCQRALDTDPGRQLGSAAAFAAVLRPRERQQSPPKPRAGRTGGRPSGPDPTSQPQADGTASARPSPAVRRSADGDLPRGRGGGGRSGAPTASRTVAIPIPTKAATSTGRAKPARKIPPVVAATAATAKSPVEAPPTVAIPIGPRAARSDAPSKAAAPAAVAPAKSRTPSARNPTDLAEPPGARNSAGPGSASPRTTDEIPVGRAPIAPVAPVQVAASAPVAPPPPAAPTSTVDAPALVGSRRAVRSDSSADLERSSVLSAFRGSTSDTASDTGEDYYPWEDTGTWGSYDDSADHPASGFFEGSPTQRKVLLYAVPVVALVLIVVLAVVAGKQFSDAVTDDSSGAVLPPVESSLSEVPTETGDQATEGEPPASPAALAPVSAAVFNPFGDGGPEHDDEVGLAYDGDAGSAWTTLTYQSTPEFGNLKPGVGLIFDLGQEYAISTIELATNMPGSAVEVRVGAAPDAALDSYPVVGTLDPFAETGSVELAEPVRARFVIIWFVRLVDSNGGFQAALAECRILGA